MAFLAPALISTMIIIWLFGVWILDMLLAPFNKEKTLLKKVTQYGSLVAVGILLVASLLPQLQEYGQPFALGAIISSLMSIFGSGRIQT
jgi:low temperature requirement protein LtrA